MFQRIALIVLAAIGLQQSGQTPLRVNVDLVNVPFSVTDRNGHLVSGLKKEDIAVEEDGRKQDIQHFIQENELPLTLGVLVDKSPSVGRVFAEEKAAAVSFLDTILKSGDLAMVISFDRVVTLEEDFTENKRALRTAINNLTVGNGTSVYDAIYLACKDQLSKQAGRKAVILISDGEDTSSKLRLNEALLAAHQSDVVIYSISNRIGGFFNDPGNGSPDTLKRLSLETGGTLFFVGGRTELRETFAQIADELRSQYTIAYNSMNPAHDGKYRRIRIITKDPTYTVKARQGYYAPTS
jgi:VWFA-related protein